MEPSLGGTFQASREYFAQESIVPSVKDHCLVKVQHMIIWIRGVVVHNKRWNDESARRHIVQYMMAQGGRQHVIQPLDRRIKCCMQGGRCPERVLLRWKLGGHAPEPGRYVFRGQFRPGPISTSLPSRSKVRNTNRPGWTGNEVCSWIWLSHCSEVADDGEAGSCPRSVRHLPDDHYG